jgi:hypothetical protein
MSEKHTLDTLIAKLESLKKEYGGKIPVYVSFDIGEIQLPVNAPNIEDATNKLPMRAVF